MGEILESILAGIIGGSIVGIIYILIGGEK